MELEGAMETEASQNQEINLVKNISLFCANTERESKRISFIMPKMNFDSQIAQ